MKFDYDIEYVEPRLERCRCCGEPQTILTRFVAVGEVPLALLQASLPEGRHVGAADLLVSIGDWSDEPAELNAVGFPLRLTQGFEGPAAQPVRPDQSGWPSTWGTSLDPRSAVEHPWWPRVQEIVRHIMRHDLVLSAYLDRYRDARGS